MLIETETPCFAWALMSNHFHLLLRTGGVPIASLMRRLLTGHAVHFNRRHNRYGHLFQNRYKSILCQEETYLLELVRYIHLNPLRAGLAEDMQALDDYPYSGHSVLVGRYRNDWQETDFILKRFGKRKTQSRRAYRAFVEKGDEKGRRPELIGGGMIRSAGGWEKIKAARANKVYLKGDERILGDSDFVGTVLAQTMEEQDKRNKLKAQGVTVDQAARKVAELMGGTGRDGMGGRPISPGGQGAESALLLGGPQIGYQYDGYGQTVRDVGADGEQVCAAGGGDCARERI